jgi:DNA polymerase III gamma/tau subunit
MENVAWFKKYQPQSIDDYVFDTIEQEKTAKKWIENNCIDGNILFCGDAGTGKTALSTILIKALINSNFDLQYIKDRSVKAIDGLQGWLEKQPVKSKKKIIYLEEFDKLSREAIGTLKDGMMEKYQETTTFICTTNHINRIDRAIRTRFTHKWTFGTTSNVDGVIVRLSNILTAEKVQFDAEQLKKFIENNCQIGMRDLINSLQIAVINNAIDFTTIKVEKSEQEQQVIEMTMRIFSYLFTSKDASQKKLCLITPMQSEISTFYSGIIDIIQYNMSIDYIDIYYELYRTINFLPIIKIINKYINDIESKRFLNLHFIAFLHDAMKSIINLNI